MVQRHSPYDGLLHEVVVHAGVLYFAGIVADEAGLDSEGQARDVLRQPDALLIANGSDRQHVLQATVYVVDLGDKDGLNCAWREFFAAADLPARAKIAADDLGRDVKLELVVTAAIVNPP